MAGRPLGSKNKDKPWSDALRLVANREDPEGRKRLLRIAETCFDAAEKGDISAIREIGDRLDGKPAQESTVHVTRAKAAEIPDDELADIAVGSGEGAAEAPLDPAQLN